MKKFGKSRIFSNKKGLTLIEILIVLALIGLIMGLFVANYSGMFSGGQRQIAKLFVKETIDVPLTAYKLHMGNYPSTEEGLKALVEAPSGKEHKWYGPYIKDPKSLIDPWGEEYKYERSSTLSAGPGQKGKFNPGYKVWSCGPGGVSGDDDDICNWKD